MNKEFEAAVTVFKALGDENRITILYLLGNGEKCSCELLKDMDITQPTLSHHIRVLNECGIIKGRREGKNIFYSISEDFSERSKKYISAVVSGRESE